MHVKINEHEYIAITNTLKLFGNDQMCRHTLFMSQLDVCALFNPLQTKDNINDTRAATILQWSISVLTLLRNKINVIVNTPYQGCMD